MLDLNGIGYYAETNTIRDQSKEEFFATVSGDVKVITEPFVGDEKSIVTLTVPIKKDNKIILLALNEEKSCEYDLISNDIKYNNRRYYIYNKMNDVIIVEDKNHNITISTTEKEIKIDKKGRII